MLINQLFSFLETKLARPRLNWFKTLVFNFRCLPFRQAMKLPIRLYGSWNFRSLEGRVILDDLEKGGVNIWRIGKNYAGYVTTSTGTLTLMKGSVWVIGQGVKISQGVHICLFPNARFEIGKYSTIGDNAKIICSNSIRVGQQCDLTWECQLLDYGTHYLQELNNNEIKNIFQSIEIADCCWIGNRTSVMPGTRLPHDTTVASNSLLNKDYIQRSIQPYSLIGGIPAKMIREGVLRLRDVRNENFLRRHFTLTHERSISSEELPIKEYGKEKTN